MSVARAENLHHNIEAVKTQLRERFEESLARASEAMLLRIVKLNDEKAYAALAKAEAEKKRSIQTRNQASIARMREAAFERVKSRCELLEASEAYDILGIKKQSLSQKTQAGQVLAYSNNRRKYYPAFQFVNNKVHPAIKTLITDLKLDPANAEAMNLLVQHLIGRMDYSDVGEPSRETQRFELLNDKGALEIIKRDFINANEMGQ
ncbi:hypothetical protein D9M68_545200 [compost metagenome]